MIFLINGIFYNCFHVCDSSETTIVICVNHVLFIDSSIVYPDSINMEIYIYWSHCSEMDVRLYVLLRYIWCVSSKNSNIYFNLYMCNFFMSPWVIPYLVFDQYIYEVILFFFFFLRWFFGFGFLMVELLIYFLGALSLVL